MDWRYAGVLVAYAAGLLPWFMNLDRQMYFFYVTPMAPFLVLLIVLALGEILGRVLGRHPNAGAPVCSSWRCTWASWWRTSSGCGRS